ncbi:MAG: anti-sigma factor domain-containing protein [Thiotrichales bacterium]
MKRYQNPELYERLAAEYVLGTLRGAARRRFERLAREHRYVRYAVDQWQARLGSMVELLPETEPSPGLWRGIERRLRAAQPLQSVSRARSGWQLRFWQATAAVASILLAVTLVQPRIAPRMDMPTYVAVLESDTQTPMMVTLGDRKTGVVTVRFMEMPTLAEDRDLQLWAIHRESQRPMPVALVPRDSMEAQFRFSQPEWQRVLRDTETFAVSFEPKGGSPLDTPSGPIMYKGRCIDFI